MKLCDFLESENIFEYAVLPFEECEIINQRKMDALNKTMTPKSVVCMVIPYYVKPKGKHNISIYAMARDYHLYFSYLKDKITSVFGDKFIGFCDSSPVNERSLAKKSGLGFFGENGLIINEKYGSFIFISEFFSNLEMTDPIFDGILPHKTKEKCLGCGKCRKSCPTGGINDISLCLSGINQKKKISDKEAEIIKESNFLWGCDACQTCCPENKFTESPIEFFRNDRVEFLTKEIIENQINDGTFKSRAYAWRGEDVLLRNIKLNS